MIRVLLCDDHRIIREGLKQILADTRDIDVAGEAADGPAVLAEVRNAARTLAIDVVLLDIAMPVRDGLDVLKSLKNEFPRLAVLMLSTYPEKQYASRCLKLGAAGYVNKGADPDELAGAIRKAAGGGIYVSAALAENLAAQLSVNTESAPHEALSQREYQVFQMIAGGDSVGHIAERLKLSPNTVSTYRARILEKTGAHNDVGIAMYAVKHGLMTM